MTVSVIIGLQWGDEGKGKMVDILAKDYDYIVRFNGGDNAGHTIKVKDKKFGLRLIPSGIFYEEKFKVLGNGVVINPSTLLKEVEDVESAGYSLKNLIISDSAHIILPWHKHLDGILSAKKIGTTKKGIGPTYADKTIRTTAIRVCDLYSKKLKEKLELTAKVKSQQLKSHGEEISYDVDKIYNELISFGNKIKPHVKNVTYLLNETEKDVLLEGAQGTFLDIDHGTYPYVTSSNVISSGACTGTGLPPKKINKIIGIVKAYTTRVGAGPFPTELQDESGEKLREKGHEFGTVTGRPRRCGWLDLVLLKKAVMVNGVDEIILTKIDVMDEFDEIKVCESYEIDGKETKQFPTNVEDLEKAKPNYVTLKGWGKITHEQWEKIKETKEFPPEMQEYMNFITNKLGVKISILSFGPKRAETIFF